MSRVPYVFDLNYDCKTEGDVREEIKRMIEAIQNVDKVKKKLKSLINLCREHGLNKLAREFSEWG